MFRCYDILHFSDLLRPFFDAFLFHVFRDVCRASQEPRPVSQNLKLVIANPTALHKKVSRLLKMDADVFVTSETSATNIIQKEISHDMKINKYRSFWCPPVAPKKNTCDDRPSYRGEALGTAIFAKIPSRITRLQVPTVLHDSQRFCSCVIRFGNTEVLVVAIYGFANRYMEGKRPNDLLLAAVASYVESVGLPFMICGDFNEPPMKLSSFEYFRNLGAVEAFTWFESRYGRNFRRHVQVPHGMTQRFYILCFCSHPTYECTFRTPV